MAFAVLRFVTRFAALEIAANKPIDGSGQESVGRRKDFASDLRARCGKMDV
jgi:hypothetical protein